MNNEVNLKDTLENLINQTYKVEEEYKILNNSYENLRKFTQEIIESMGAAIWVVSNGGKITLQNTLAQNSGIFALVDTSKTAQEIELEGRIYAVKITQKDDSKIILATDISDEKRSARLVSMGAIAAHLSHEIRNPIGSIALLAGTLLRRADEKNRPLIEEITKAIYRVERIIKATLLFAKGVRIAKSDFALEFLKTACQNAVRQYAFSKPISFEFDGFEGAMSGDFDLLDMVFSNFIFNAIDAIEEGPNETGAVFIRHEFTGIEHVFYIGDDGVAINPDVIFEPFKTTKLKGNGLGLALSIEIINAHGGSLALQNDPKIFTITLPS